MFLIKKNTIQIDIASLKCYNTLRVTQPNRQTGKEKIKMKNSKAVFAGVALSAIMIFSGCGNSVEKVEYTHGTVSGTTYTNEMIGAKADFGDGWTYFSDEDIASMNGISDFTKENTDKAFSTNGVVYDMYVANADNENLNVLLEDLTRTNNASLDEQGYVDAAIGDLKTQLETQFTVDSLEQEKITFLGSEVPCVKITLDVSGTKLYEYQTYKKVGQYMCVFTATALSAESAEEIIGKFTAA